jgi:hypothetical protein
MDWADGYEHPAFDGRSRARHEQWLRTVPCPVLRLDSSSAMDELVAAVEEPLTTIEARARPQLP